MRVFYAQSFGADLDEITEFIAADNPERAVSFVEEIRWVCAKCYRRPPAAWTGKTGVRAGHALVGHPQPHDFLYI